MSTTKPKVSICIPAYKQVDYLRRTLESVQLQNFKNYEIIITDDSPDNSVKELIEKFYLPDQVKYFKNKVNLGSPENWNEAIRYAEGEYVKIMHHDDWFTSENSLEEFVRILDENPDANFGFSATLVWQVDSDTNWVHKATDEQLKSLSHDSRCLFFGNFIGAPSCTIYRRTITEKYDPKLKWVVDFDFYIQVLQKNQFIFCPKPLVCTPSGVLHQITQSCINNKKIELFEYTYLFKKIYSKDLNLKAYKAFFEKLFIKYELQAYKEFNSIGIEQPQPEDWFRQIISDLTYIRLKINAIAYLKRNKVFKNLIQIAKIFKKNKIEVRNS